MFLKFFAGLRPMLALGFCLAAPALLAQTTRNVGAGQTYTTIQAGIDAAVNGDTVLVAPGTYYENIDFKGKAITVTSSGGAAITVIDGGQKSPAVTFATSEQRASVLSGFTIQHGGVLSSTLLVNGGIYLSGSSPTIRNDILTQNNCWTIYSYQSAPLIQNNEISATQDPHGNCSFGGGAGIYISGNLGGIGTPTGAYSALIIGNTIENNVESGFENSGANGGPGGNGTAGGNGGAGVAIWGGSPIIVGNTIRNNSSPGGTGGAINVVEGQGISIVQNLIYGNNGGCGGGALALSGNTDSRTGIAELIANNTIVDNVDKADGGYDNCKYVSEIYPSPPTYGVGFPGQVFVNNVISGSTPYPAVYCATYAPSNLLDQPAFSHNILYNGGGPFFGYACVDVSNTNNNVTTKPQFVNAAAGDYHLVSGSAGIDAGDNSVLQTFLALTGMSLTTDFDGKPRVQDATGKGCVIDMGAYEFAGSYSLCGTTETLTSSLNPSTYGQSVTFMAQLLSQNGVPTGSVKFSDGATVLGTQVVSGAGAAVYSTSQLAAGSHTITSAYQPSGSFPAETASLTQVVNGTPTTTALSCSPSTIAVGGTALLTAAVTSANGSPAGVVSFTDNGVALGTQTLTGGAATFTYTGAAAGTHTMTANYAAAANFGASAGSCAVVVTTLPSVATLQVSPTLSSYGSPVVLTATVAPLTTPNVGTPTGTVTFFNGSAALGTGTLLNGVASITINTLLPPGSPTLGCTYNGSIAYAPSACNTAGAVVTLAATATSVTAAPNPAYLGQAVTLNAMITASGVVVPVGGGSVTFFDGTSTLGTGTVSAGSASFVTSSLTAGTHTITASFKPVGVQFAGSTSSAVSEVILPSGFTVAVVPGTLTLQQGAAGAVAVQLGSVGAFAGPLNLSVGAMPANSIAAFDHGTVTLATGAAGAAMLTIRTVITPVRAAVDGNARPAGRVVALAVLGLLIPFGLLRRGRLAHLLCIMLLAVATLGLSGCTELYAYLPSLAPGTYQIPVTATDSNGISQTATLTLVVTGRL